MGLDLLHLKATLRPSRPEDAHVFHEEDFDQYALDVLGFRRFLQTIPWVEDQLRIVAVKDEQALNFLRAHKSWMLKEGVEILVGDPAAWGQRVERFEKSQGLDGSGRMVHAGTWWIDQTGCHVSHGHGGLFRPPDEKHWEPTEAIREAIRRRPPLEHPPVQLILISYPVPAPYRGLYADEIGYQRKGMSDAFYEAFGSPTWYVRRSDVERAAALLDLSGTPEENHKRRDAFATQFLAGFEEGTSIFLVSW